MYAHLWITCAKRVEARQTLVRFVRLVRLVVEALGNDWTGESVELALERLVLAFALGFASLLPFVGFGLRVFAACVVWCVRGKVVR